MQILFLDFDGVLNSQAAYDQAGGGDWRLYREHVAVLNDILAAAAELQIVVSSSWRFDRDKAELERLLAEQGGAVGGRILDVTPRTLFLRRGEEIDRWLRLNPAVERWVILDDIAEELTAAQLERAVITDPAVGLRTEHVSAVLRALDRGVGP